MSPPLNTGKSYYLLFHSRPYSLQNLYRSLSVLAEESDYIQEELYRNSKSKIVQFDAKKENSHTLDKYWGYGCFLLLRNSSVSSDTYSCSEPLFFLI